MTEKSYYWSNATVGDGVYSPYNDGEFSDIWRKILTRDRTLMGYIDGYLNELEVTATGGDAIQIDTGAALVDGKFYENDAAIPQSVSTPVSATRNDRIVLRKTWAEQTVRVETINGEEGSGVPSLTQEDGSIWEIPLAVITITTGGVITVTDDRTVIISPLAPNVTGNFEEIETVSGDGSSGNIAFNNIPQTYTHLKIVGQGRSDRAILKENCVIILNGSGINYEFQIIDGKNATASSSSSAGTSILIGKAVAASAGANYSSIFEIIIPNYSNSNFYKQILSKSICMPSNTVGDFELQLTGGQWSNTNAITSIYILIPIGNWITGSTFTLYGMN